jgi:hypothetical protein
MFRIGCFLLASVFPGFLHAAVVLDQAHTPASLTVSSSFGGDFQQAQTFTVGVTGTLVRIDIVGFASNPFSFDVRGQTASRPDNATVLQTVTVPALASGGAFTPIALSVPVVAGDMLSFVAYGGGGGQLRGASSTPPADGYAPGSIWTFGNPPFGLDGPGTWYPNGNSSSNADLSFRTFVDDGAPMTPIPLPGALPLALGALGGFGLLAVRRKGAGRRRHA